MLKLPSQHTDAENFAKLQAKARTNDNVLNVHSTETIADHAPSEMAIDVNPTMWKMQLAQLWVKYSRVDADGKPYNLKQGYIFEKLPKDYHWMSSKPVYLQTYVPDYAVMACVMMDGRCEVLVWRGIDEFWPHFKWLMESTPGACGCVRCKVVGDDDDVVCEREGEAAAEEVDEEAEGEGRRARRSERMNGCRMLGGTTGKLHDTL